MKIEKYAEDPTKCQTKKKVPLRHRNLILREHSSFESINIVLIT